jgi:hypothetical protein
MDSVPTQADFLVLFINAFFTTTSAITTALLSLIPVVIQLGLNFLFGLFTGTQQQ